MNASLLTCTLTELALSADNALVWALIMRRAGVPARQQRWVLLAGIGIAVVLRVAAIAAGAAALERLAWLTYVLAGVLVWTGYRILRGGDDDAPSFRLPGITSPAVKATLALGVTDLVFAVDSIPASFGITRDPVTIIVANGIALAALWSLYGGVSWLLDRCRYLHYGLAAVMFVLAAEMATEHFYPLPEYLTLAAIGTCLSVAAGWPLYGGVRPRRGHCTAA